jgi:hypothetical protein
MVLLLFVDAAFVVVVVVVVAAAAADDDNDNDTSKGGVGRGKAFAAFFLSKIEARRRRGPTR